MFFQNTTQSFYVFVRLAGIAKIRVCFSNQTIFGTGHIVVFQKFHANNTVAKGVDDPGKGKKYEVIVWNWIRWWKR